MSRTLDSITHALLAIGCALAVGGWLALTGVYGAVLLTALAAVALALVLPWSWLLWSLLVTVFALVGPLQYFGGVDKAFWLPYLMSLVIGVRCVAVAASLIPVDQPADRQARLRWAQWPAELRAATLLFGLWMACAVAASLAHRISPLQALVAGKEYFFLWALPLAFALGLMRWPMLGRWWRWVTAWLALQVPVVVWQRVFVAPARGGESPWDAVVGVFAGRALGGGGSGTMALVSLWAAALVALAWRHGRAGGLWAATAVACALLACSMAEVKIALLAAPLMAMMVAVARHDTPQAHRAAQGARAPASPHWRSLALALAGVGISALLLLAHQQQFSSRRSAEGQSMERYVGTMVQRNLDDRSQADPHGQLTRLGALRFWWQRQQAQDVPGWLVGHGIGSARRSHLFVGAMARPWRMEIGRSTAAILLWETGVLGLLAWTGGIAASALAAWRMAQRRVVSPESATPAWMLQACSALLVIALLSLPYGADWFESPHLSTAVMLALGLILGAARSESR